MREVLWGLSAYVVVAVAAALIIYGIRKLVSSTRTLSRGKFRVRKARWLGFDVFLSFCIFAGMRELIVGTLLALGAFAFLGPAPELDCDAQTLARYSVRRDLVCSPVLLTGVLVSWFTWLFLRHGVRPRDFGLTFRRGPGDITVGLTAMILFTPILLGLHALARWIFGERPQPFTVENTANFTWWEWGLVAFQVCVSAPLIEETLFRGILQRWLRRATLRGQYAIVLATLVLAGFAVSYRDADTDEALTDVAPMVFAVLLVGVYLYALYNLRQKFELTDEEVAACRSLPP